MAAVCVALVPQWGQSKAEVWCQAKLPKFNLHTVSQPPVREDVRSGGSTVGKGETCDGTVLHSQRAERREPCGGGKFPSVIEGWDSEWQSKCDTKATLYPQGVQNYSSSKGDRERRELGKGSCDRGSVGKGGGDGERRNRAKRQSERSGQMGTRGI